MLQKLRIFLAWLIMSLFIVLFLGWVRDVPVAKIEFLPSLLAGNLMAVGALLFLALLLGRMYCSVLCPLDIMQDAIIWLANHGRKIPRFHYLPARNRLRAYILLATGAAFVLGFSVLPVILDPYSIFGRMMTNIFSPLFQVGHGFLAVQLEQAGYSWLTREDFVWLGAESLILAAAYLSALGYVSWRWGRLYCHTICPVGSALGTVSRHAALRLQIDAEKCVSCGLCEKSCRSSCLDAKEHFIDHSRCVMCGDCQAACPKGAISLRLAWGQEKENKSGAAGAMPRRQFLGETLAAAGLILAAGWQGKKANASASAAPVMPPGALSSENFHASCTACQLCVDQCPHKVLSPSVAAYGLEGFMQPRLDFSHGYCGYDCTHCSDICPAGALQPMDIKDKQRLQIGKAVYEPAHCLPQYGRGSLSSLRADLPSDTPFPEGRQRTAGD